MFAVNMGMDDGCGVVLNVRSALPSSKLYTSPM